jgi:hypothetical protein
MARVPRQRFSPALRGAQRRVRPVVKLFVDGVLFGTGHNANAISELGLDSGAPGLRSRVGPLGAGQWQSDIQTEMCLAIPEPSLKCRQPSR